MIKDKSTTSVIILWTYKLRWCFSFSCFFSVCNFSKYVCYNLFVISQTTSRVYPPITNIHYDNFLFIITSYAIYEYILSYIAIETNQLKCSSIHKYYNVAVLKFIVINDRKLILIWCECVYALFTGEFRNIENSFSLKSYFACFHELAMDQSNHIFLSFCLQTYIRW